MHSVWKNILGGSAGNAGTAEGMEISCIADMRQDSRKGGMENVFWLQDNCMCRRDGGDRQKAGNLLLLADTASDGGISGDG